MNYLVDTHILLWSFLKPEKLSSNVKTVLLDRENEIYYSPINLWEIAIKYRLGKLKLKGLTPEEFYDELEESYYLCKEINNRDIISSYRLPYYHKDPFDRFLLWEALRNDFIFINADSKMEDYEKEGITIVV